MDLRMAASSSTMATSPTVVCMRSRRSELAWKASQELVLRWVAPNGTAGSCTRILSFGADPHQRTGISNALQGAVGRPGLRRARLATQSNETRCSAIGPLPHPVCDLPGFGIGAFLPADQAESLGNR